MRGAVVLKDELRSTKGESVLRSLAKNRVALGSSRDQCYAFLMARHLRLGEDSPARVLVKDMFKYICSFVIKREKLLFFRQGSFLELDLNSGALVELPPMPVSLSNGFGCIRSNNKELFVFGGVDDAHTPNLDCFVFEFASRTWRCEENVFGEDDGRLNGSCVIYKNLVVVVGSMRPAAQLASEAAPDFAFLLPSGKIVDLPPRPGMDCFGVTKSILLGSFLVVFATAPRCKFIKWDVAVRRPPEEPRKCCQSFVYLDLNNMHFGWKTLPPIPSHVFRCNFCLDGTKIVVSGGARKEPNGYFVSNTTKYWLDLKTLPDSPVWEFKENRVLLAHSDQIVDVDAMEVSAFCWELDGGALLEVVQEESNGESVLIDSEEFFSSAGTSSLVLLREYDWA